MEREMRGPDTGLKELSEWAEIAAEAIAERGYIIIPNFLPGDEIDALRAIARRHDAAGGFRAAGVGAGEARRARSEVRGDRIRWLDAQPVDGAERAALHALEGLRRAVNAATYAGLFSLECHYAIYPPGARYQRHFDQFRDDDSRLLSVVLYLNEEWRPGDGGELMLHVDDGAIEIRPIGGTLVAFFSAQFEHEVLPATRERFSLTGWFRRSDLSKGNAD